MIGKVDPALLGRLILSRTGADDDRVIQGPAYGEDTAAVDVGGQTLVVNTDPISLAIERIGTLGVDIACNDVAASGGVPAWLTVTLFLPTDRDPEGIIDPITRQLDEAARRVDVAIVGGHSEYDAGRDRPMLVVTCLGLADRYVRTGGADPGDDVILTKGAGIEGTAILATDFREELAADVPDEVFDSGGTFYDELSVIPESRILTPEATAMHDPTEGGLVDGLLELASASGVALSVDPDAIPVREETAALCGAAGVDPLRIFGSGALVATLAPEQTDPALDALEAAGITAARIGTVEAAPEPRLDLGDERITEPVRDEMYALWE